MKHPPGAPECQPAVTWSSCQLYLTERDKVSRNSARLSVYFSLTVEKATFFISAKLKKIRKGRQYKKRGSKQTVLRNMNRKRTLYKNTGTGLVQSHAQTRGLLRAAARSHGAAAGMGQDGSIPMVKAVSMLFSWSRAIEAEHLHWPPPPPPVLLPITGTFLQCPRKFKAEGSRGMIVWRMGSTTGSTDWGHLAHGQNVPAPCLSNIQPRQHHFGPSLHTCINMISSQEWYLMQKKYC